MKKFKSLLIIASMLTLVGCASQATPDSSTGENTSEISENTDIDKAEEDTLSPLDLYVIAPSGTPAITLTQMLVEDPIIADHVSINYEIVSGSDVLTASLVNQEADIAVVPTNLAANLYNQNEAYQLAGVGTWGSFYIVSADDISSLDDLRDQTIALTGRGVVPDATLRYILTENDIDPDTDLTLEYFASASEVAANYISGQASIAMIPEPVLTNVLSQREDTSIVIDVQEEWQKVTGLDNYPQSSLIVSKELIDSHPDVVDSFIDLYSDSIAWANANPSEAGVYYEQLDLGLTSDVIEQAIPRSALNFVPAKEAKESLDFYFDILYSFNPQLLGNAPAQEGMYLE